MGALERGCVSIEEQQTVRERCEGLRGGSESFFGGELRRGSLEL